jgi:hypothetical protein
MALAENAPRLRLVFLAKAEIDNPASPGLKHPGDSYRAKAKK